MDTALMVKITGTGLLGFRKTEQPAALLHPFILIIAHAAGNRVFLKAGSPRANGFRRYPANPTTHQPTKPLTHSLTHSLVKR
jgi:hypothetical protein